MIRKHEAKKPIYPITEWDIVEEKFTIENNYRNETIFSIGNGYIGFRGNLEEGYSGPKGTGLEGTYINGFFETEVIKYPETAYGFAEKSQTMLNVTNSKVIKLFIEDEEFNMQLGHVTEYKRVLSLKEGLLRRSLIWSSPKGKKVRIDIERMVSLSNKHLAAVSYRVTPLNFSGSVKLVSMLDGDVTNLTADNDPRVGSGLHGRVLTVENKLAEDNFGVITQRTQKSCMTLACAMINHIETKSSFTAISGIDELKVSVEYEVKAEEGEEIKLEKYISYVTSRDFEKKDLMVKAKNLALDGYSVGFDALKREQYEFLKEFWEKTDVVIKGDDALQQGIRVNMFHLLQSAGRDGKTNIAAKGLTGEGYEGHYFWDTETYILPFFLYNNPEISRKLLEYRYGTLDKARERARQLAHRKGALYPWRTIDGEECSSYFPAGTAQYHIDADIAFAVKRYMKATEDIEFLINFGAEILFETARLWADLGAFIPKKGNKFCINGVTGPDEYSAIVNNNCYTNLMAKVNLEYACEVAEFLQRDYPGDYSKLADKICLSISEINFWKIAASNMYIPYDENEGLYLQDDSFLDRSPWDFENTPADKYPLLLHYHPLVIYRHQVCKQADLVLALFLLGDLFTMEEKQKNFDFYERFITHDSSLSTAVFSIVACEIGYYDKACKYFMSTARLDLDDYHGNTKDGVHAANMAGTWMCLVNGFAGMRAYGDELSFNPYIPDNWEGYSFKVDFKGRLIKVNVDKSGTYFELLKGDEIEIIINKEKLLLKKKVDSLI